MPTISEQISLANQHQRMGRLDEAEIVVREILRDHPQHDEALHMQSLISHHSGQLDAAIQWAQRAIEVSPQQAVYFQTLGVLYRAAHRDDEAIRCYQQSIKIDPNDADVHYNLGNALHDKGLLEDADACYRRALQLKPTHAKAGYKLGKVLQDNDQIDDAMICFESALRVKPDLVDARIEIGNLLESQGKLDEAARSLTQAIRYDANCAKAYNNLAKIRIQQGKLDVAESCFREALRIDPNSAVVCHNLGQLFRDQDRLDEAAEYYQKAVELDPRHAKANLSLARARWGQGDVVAALESCGRALQLNPGDVEAHVLRAHSWLISGDFERGWAEYEWRWKLPSAVARKPRFRQPVWDGSILKEETILLYTEQKPSDAIQFVRFAPLVKKRVQTVLLACHEPMRHLLSRCEGIDQVVTIGEPLPEFHTHAALLSVPRILKIIEQNLPADIPYLTADPDRSTSWRERVAAGDALTIGLAWRGGQTSSRGQSHSIPLPCFTRLADLPGIRFFSLQSGTDDEDVARVFDRLAVTDLGPEYRESNDPFAEAAAVIDNLDLVISADTPLSHLAGALGKAVWIALAHAPRWCWQLNRSDSPWYPSAQLFRQSSAGDWEGVFQQIRAALTQFAHQRTHGDNEHDAHEDNHGRNRTGRADRQDHDSPDQGGTDFRLGET